MRLFVLLALLFAGQIPHHWAEIDSDTRKLAQDELDRLQRDGGGGRSASVFKNTHLEEPFYYYASDAGFSSFAADSSNDLLPYLAWREVMFPVVSGNDAIGVLRLRDTGGGPQCYFIPVPEGIYDRFKDALRRVRLDRDQRLSVATTGQGGDYFLIEDGTTIYRMAPCTTRTLLLLGLNDQHVEDLRFLAPKDMGPLIKRAMRGGE